MILDLTGLRIEVTDAIKDFTEKKVEKLDKFFEPDTICHVTFTSQVKGKQHVDIRIEYKSHTYLAEDETEDLYGTIEELISKIERQARKEKTSNIDKKRKEGLPAEEQTEDIEDLLEE